MVRISFITCVFLVCLRLAIGWHFFFEGLNKYESAQRGKTDYSRPFTSAPYFAQAQGPLASMAQDKIGTADSEALAKLKLSNLTADKPAAQMPAALANEWDTYLARFKDEYKLDEASRQKADTKLEESKIRYVQWLTDDLPKPKDGQERKKEDEPKKIKKTIVTSGAPVEYEVADKVQQRVLDYEMKLREIREQKKRLIELGNVEKVNPRLRTLETEAAIMRADLMKDVEDHTDKLKKALAKLVSDKLAGFNVAPAGDPHFDEKLLALLKLKEGPEGAKATDEQLIARMPTALDEQWDAYAAYVREVGKSTRADDNAAQLAMQDAKLRYVRRLLDLDPFDGRPLPDKEATAALAAYREAASQFKSAREAFNQPENEFNPVDLVLKSTALAMATAKVVPLRKAFIDDIASQTEYLKKRLGGFSEETAKGTVVPEKPVTRFLWRDWPNLPTTNQEWIDWSTRWLLLIAGGCLLVGLFSRLACLACAGFLVMEYLFNSPFPWFPASPKAEGNYLYINKNVIEFLALIVLATLPTGRWLGLDAILSRIWPFRRKTREAAPRFAKEIR
jgi:uncharacterized membrane protein YphA (DoxX/SURF4 family)